MDTGHTQGDTPDSAPRGADRVRAARSTRRSQVGRYWRLALVVVAIALAILVVSATRARARPAADAAAYPVRVGTAGGPERVPLAPVTSGALL